MNKNNVFFRFFRFMGRFFKKLFAMILNPHFLICFSIAWIITNGWSYACLGIGLWTGTHWMTAIATTYLAFLWLPGTPEKIATFAISIFLLKLIFPKDEKTLGAAKSMFSNAKQEFQASREKRKQKKEEKKRLKAEKSKKQSSGDQNDDVTRNPEGGSPS